MRTFLIWVGIALFVLWIINNPAQADTDVHHIGQFLNGIVH